MNFDFRTGRPLSLDHLRLGSLWLGLGAVLVGAILVGSLASVPKTASAFLLHDKLLHLFAYTVLMSWFAQLFRHDLARLVLALGFVALGIGIEYLQGMTPTRQFDPLDMLANTSGVLLAWALSYTWVGRLLPAFERLFLGAPERA